MMREPHVIRPSAKQRARLEEIVARPSEGAGLVRRVRVVLLSADGVSGKDIALRLDLSPEAVSRIRQRFAKGGVDGLLERPKSGRKDHAVPAETVERIVQLAMSPCTSRVFPRHPVLGVTSGQLASGTSWAASEIGGRSHWEAMRS